MPAQAMAHGDGGGHPHRRATAEAQPPGLSLAACVQVLDVLAIGLVLVDADLRVCHVNRCATQLGWRLDQGVGLRMLQGWSAQSPLEHAVRRACAGLWSMTLAHCGQQPMPMAVVPLAPAGSDEAGQALLVLAPDRTAAPLMLHFFAQAHGLTRAEAAVLAGLGRGLSPQAVASSLSVAIATVRTHVSAIRAKTGAANLRALVAQVHRLPPVAPHLASAGSLPN